MTKNLLATTLAAATLLAAAPVYAAPIELVRNGNFEANGVANGTWTVLSTLNNWVVGPNGVEVRNAVAGTASAGRTYLELDAYVNTWISQSVATTAGGLYNVSFDYAAREFTSSATNGIEVLWGGVSRGIYSWTSTTSGNDWRHFTLSLAGVGPATNLEFRAVGTSDGLGGSLDNISVTSAVPEPGSVALIGLGLIGLLGFRRRQA